MSTPYTQPGQLIANIPGILGFYPTNCVVVVTLCTSQNDEASCAINPQGVTLFGPVLRADFDRVVDLDRAVAALDTQAPITSLYAVIITDDPDSGEALQTQELLFCATEADGAALVDACWHVSEIATGAAYRPLFGSSAGQGTIWHVGQVANVAATEAMRQNVESGILPVADKDTINDYFALKPVDDDVDLAEQADLIRQATNAINTAFSHEGSGDTEQLVLMLRHAEMALYFAPERDFIDTDSGEVPRLFDLVPDYNARMALYGALSTSRTRDALINTSLDSPDSAAGVLLAIGRETHHDLIRANALSLWAMIAVDKNSSTWAQAAARAALTRAPRHQLASLIEKALRHGKGDQIVPVSRQGCTDTWDELLTTP